MDKGFLPDRLGVLLFRLGMLSGRRICCGCGELEGYVGDLVDFAWTLDKREIRYRTGQPVESTFSRYTSVVSRLCRDCDRLIRRHQVGMVNLEMRSVYRNGELVSRLLVEANTGVSLRALPEPQLCLVPPPEDIPVGGVSGL